MHGKFHFLRDDQKGKGEKNFLEKVRGKDVWVGEGGGVFLPPPIWVYLLVWMHVFINLCLPHSGLGFLEGGRNETITEKAVSKCAVANNYANHFGGGLGALCFGGGSRF